jgi:Rieske Fe-S protein
MAHRPPPNRGVQPAKVDKPAAAPSAAKSPPRPADLAADGRRGFFKKALAVLTGVIAGFVPLAAGVAFLLDPIRRRRFVPLARRKGASGATDDGFVFVTTMDALPADGRPQKFTVIADQSDAWNYFPDQRIGNVFLRRIGEEEVIAFNEICPHLGCSVEYNPRAPENMAFKCPCHASAFALTGEKSNAIPPRNLDKLDAETRNGGEVWVRYQKFRTGFKEQIPAS